MRSAPAGERSPLRSSTPSRAHGVTELAGAATSSCISDIG
jgi:hypothetical protein